MLVDSDPGTWTMDVRAAAERVTPRTRAIMPVHIYGHPVEMELVLALAAGHGLAIIEDAAEAHGSECNVGGEWRRAGSFGELSTFSFFANKLVTTGEGGMVVTDDDALAARLRALRNLSFVPERRFYHEALGYNYRLTNLQAALGVAQVERMGEIVQRKRVVGSEYVRRLSSVPGVQMQVEEPWARSVHWMVRPRPRRRRPVRRGRARAAVARARRRHAAVLPGDARAAGVARAGAVRRVSGTRWRSGWRGAGCTCRPASR